MDLFDASGRAAAEETGLTFALLDTTPLPALVEFAGGAYGSAASWSVDQYLRYAAGASNVADTVSDFIEAVDWTDLTKSFLKETLCSGLQLFLELRIEDFAGIIPSDSILVQRAEEKFQEVCWEVAGKIPFL